MNLDKSLINGGSNMRTLLFTLFLMFLMVTAAIAKEEPAQGRIELSQSRSEILGTFISGERLTFRSTAKSDNRFEVSVQFRGTKFEAMIDNATKTAGVSASTLKAGFAHRLTIEDKQMLLGALRAVEGKRKAENLKLTPAWLMLERTLNLWSDWPLSFPLQQTIRANPSMAPMAASSITTLCSYAKCQTANGLSYFGPCLSMVYYSYASHDCYKGGFSNPVNQQRASLGAHYTCSGDELYWNGSAWACGEPDHWYRPSVTGNCFGRCGGDCGEVSVYSVDCTNHDGCVRNGHALASMYCNDQFSSASDDYLFGTPCYTSTP